MEIGSLVEKSGDERSQSETVDQKLCIFALGLQFLQGNGFAGWIIWNFFFINVGVFGANGDCALLHTT